jgi:hypothetical protein
LVGLEDAMIAPLRLALGACLSAMALLFAACASAAPAATPVGPAGTPASTLAAPAGTVEPPAAASPASPTPAPSLALTITGPDGESFSARQARKYVATLTGAEDLGAPFAKCHWRMFINERETETLLTEMENRSVISDTTSEICPFTSTFVDRQGKLRVELTVEVTTMGGDVVATARAERMYLVHN